MTNTNNNTMTLPEFERLLEVYGGDRTRWPAEERAAAAQLVARDAAARRSMAEAEALDRVLDRAPLPALAVEAALADRIVAAAQRSPRIVRANPVLAAAAPIATVAAPERAPAVPPKARFEYRSVRAAGVLAASLVAGIFIGLSNLPQSVLPELADMVSVERATHNLAQIEPFDEDVL
jgi:hypothetical protein